MADIRWNPMPRADFGDAVSLLRLANDTGNNTVVKIGDTLNQFAQNAQTNNNAKVQQYIDNLPIDQVVNNTPAILQQAHAITGNSFAGLDDGVINNYIQARPAILNQRQRDANNTALDNADTQLKFVKTNDDINAIDSVKLAKGLQAAYSVGQTNPTQTKQMLSVLDPILNTLSPDRLYDVGLNKTNYTLTDLTNTNKIGTLKDEGTNRVITNAIPVVTQYNQGEDLLKSKLAGAKTEKDKAEIGKQLLVFQASKNKALEKLGVTSNMIPALNQKATEYGIEQRTKTTKIDNVASQTKVNNANAGFTGAKTKEVMEEIPYIKALKEMELNKGAAQITNDRQKVANDTATVKLKAQEIAKNDPKAKAQREALAKTKYAGMPLTLKDNTGNSVINKNGIIGGLSTSINEAKQSVIDGKNGLARKNMSTTIASLEKDSYATGDDWASNRLEKLSNWFNEVSDKTGVPLQDHEKEYLLSNLRMGGQLKFNEFFSLGDGIDSKATKLLNDYRNQVNKEMDTKAKLAVDSDVTAIAGGLGIGKADVINQVGLMGDSNMYNYIPDDVKNTLSSNNAKTLVSQVSNASGSRRKNFRRVTPSVLKSSGNQISTGRTLSM